MASWFAMNGYGAWVWGSYAAFVLLLAVELAWLYGTSRRVRLRSRTSNPRKGTA